MFEPVVVGQTVHIGACGITPLPGLGYRLDSGSASLIYSGDTTLCDAFWEVLDIMENLSCLLIETTFLIRAENAKARR